MKRSLVVGRSMEYLSRFDREIKDLSPKTEDLALKPETVDLRVLAE